MPTTEPAADQALGDSALTGAGPDQRTIVVYSLIAGLCPLIPLPLLDDFVLDRVRRRLVERLAQRRGIALVPGRLAALADRDPVDWSAVGCLRFALWWPLAFVYKNVLRKIFRKILFVLAIKDSVDEVSRTMHDAWLLRHAMDAGYLADAAAAPDREATQALRRAIDAVREEIDPRPFESTLRAAFLHSRRLLRGMVRVLGSTARRVRRNRIDDDLSWVDSAAERAEHDAPGLVDALLAAFRRERSYLQSVSARLDARMGRPEPGYGAET